MAYSTAKKCFKENLEMIGSDSMRDPMNWNLYNGLVNLTGALEDDLVDIHSKAKQILQRVDQIQRAQRQ